MAQKIKANSQIVDSFSTSEVDTGKKWIDGRTIYRKSYSGTLNVAAGSGLAAFAHGISGLSSDCLVVSAIGCISLSATSGFTQRQILPFLNGADRFHMGQIDQTNVQYHATFGWGNSRYWFTMEYVK